MKLAYNVSDKPKFGQLIIFAFQQLLAILAATIAVPAIVGNGMSQSAALFGAGIGTLVYLLLTGFKSPVFLGSSFAFLGSMAAALADRSGEVEPGYVNAVGIKRGDDALCDWYSYFNISMTFSAEVLFGWLRGKVCEQ